MKPELYQPVALKRDLPEHRLKAGDVAVLVDRAPHPQGGAEGCVLEIFNALGESIVVAVVPAHDIEPLRSDEVLSVRSLLPIR